MRTPDTITDHYILHFVSWKIISCSGSVDVTDFTDRSVTVVKVYSIYLYFWTKHSVHTSVFLFDEMSNKNNKKNKYHRNTLQYSDIIQSLSDWALSIALNLPVQEGGSAAWYCERFCHESWFLRLTLSTERRSWVFLCGLCMFFLFPCEFSMETCMEFD